MRAVLPSLLCSEESALRSRDWPQAVDNNGSRLLFCRRRFEMASYVILSRFSPEAFTEPKNFRKLAAAVSTKIKKECKRVTWKQSFATLGRFDVVDIVEADDVKDIERAAMIIRSHGHSITETLVATPWEDFLAAL
jgi:uncharacterized protein with GYD domain